MAGERPVSEARKGTSRESVPAPELPVARVALSLLGRPLNRLNIQPTPYPTPPCPRTLEPDCIGDKVFKEAIKLKGGHQGGP